MKEGTTFCLKATATFAGSILFVLLAFVLMIILFTGDITPLIILLTEIKNNIIIIIKIIFIIFATTCLIKEIR